MFNIKSTRMLNIQEEYEYSDDERPYYSLNNSTLEKEFERKGSQYENQKLIQNLNLFTENSIELNKKSSNTGKMIINPGKKIVIVWELLNLICILIIFVQIPMALAFSKSYREQEDTGSAFTSLNLISIIIFILNMLVKTRKAFYKQGILQTNRKIIIRNYIKFQFFIDLVTIASIIPFEIDQFYFDMDMRKRSLTEGLSILPFLFYIRLFEVFQIIQNINRVLQLNRKSKAIFNLAILIILILEISNFYACLYFLISKNYCDTHQHYDVPICWVESMITEGFPLNHESQQWYVQYIYSLYWAITTMITIGYGDITPKNVNEVSFTIIVMFTSCILYAYSINKIWEIKGQFDQNEEKYQRKVLIINRYMRDKKVDPLLKSKILAYLGNLYKQSKIRQKQQEKEIIDELGPKLKQELLMNVYGSILKNSFIFGNFSQDFLTEISYQIEQIRYSENQILYYQGSQEIQQNLYYLFEGSISIILELKQCRKLIANIQNFGIFGQFEFFTQLAPLSKAVARRYSSLYTISPQKWKPIITKFSSDFQKFCQIKDLALTGQNLTPLNLACKICQSIKHLTIMCCYDKQKQDHILYIRNYRYSSNNRDYKYQRTSTCAQNLKCIIHQRRKPLKFFYDLPLLKNESKVEELYQPQSQVEDALSNSLHQTFYQKQLSLKSSRSVKSAHSVHDNFFHKIEIQKKIEYINIQDDVLEEQKYKLDLQQRRNQKKIIVNLDSVYIFQSYFSVHNLDNIILEYSRANRNTIITKKKDNTSSLLVS